MNTKQSLSSRVNFDQVLYYFVGLVVVVLESITPFGYYCVSLGNCISSGNLLLAQTQLYFMCG